MKRSLLLTAVCAVAAGCGLPPDLGSSEQDLGKCDGATCEDAGQPDSGEGDAGRADGGSVCNGGADAGQTCGPCGPGLAKCEAGDVCVDGVCQRDGDGGSPDGGVSDGGSGCDGDADAGQTCGPCGPGLPKCEHGDVCVDGVCRPEGDGGAPDAG
jgi:hypothetical protein